MTGQLESNHYYREGDTVRAVDGRIGEVVDARTHYALVRWEDGETEEVEQLDGRVWVIERSRKA